MTLTTRFSDVRYGVCKVGHYRLQIWAFSLSRFLTAAFGYCQLSGPPTSLPCIWHLGLSGQYIYQWGLVLMRFVACYNKLVCIDQLNIVDGLRMLPVSLMACKHLLVLFGQTYPNRLWCAWELFTLLAFSVWTGVRVHNHRIGGQTLQVAREPHGMQTHARAFWSDIHASCLFSRGCQSHTASGHSQHVGPLPVCPLACLHVARMSRALEYIALIPINLVVSN